MNCANCGNEVSFLKGILIWHDKHSVGHQYTCLCGAVNQISFSQPFYETCFVDAREVEISVRN